MPGRGLRGGADLCEVFFPTLSSLAWAPFSPVCGRPCAQMVVRPFFPSLFPPRAMARMNKPGRP